MTTWKRVYSEDDEWEEWHREVMHPAKGRVMAKVWRSFSGDFMASTTDPQGCRSVLRLEAIQADKALAEADSLLALTPQQGEGR